MGQSLFRSAAYAGVWGQILKLGYIYVIWASHITYKQILYKGKESACNAGDLGSIPGLGRSPGGGHCNPLQYSCLENPMDRGAWQAIVPGVTKSWTRLHD